MANQLKTVGLLGVLAALVVGAGSLLAPGRIEFFVALALLMNLGAYFFSDRLVLSMHGARELSPREAPELFRIVDELSARAGIPAPRLYLIAGRAPNAFATGRGPGHAALAVTEGLLRVLDLREIRGVLAHEIAHVVNRDVLIASVAAGLVTALAYLADAFRWGLIFGQAPRDEEGRSNLGGGLVVALVAPLVATLVQFAISRSREFLADETGARLSGDPGALADALAALEGSVVRFPEVAGPATASLFIVNPLHGGGITELFSTHPSTAERVARLRRMEAEARGFGAGPPRLRRVLAF